MPKKGGKKGKGTSLKAPDYCVDQFGVPPGARLVTPSGVMVTVAGMGVIDEKLYAMFPGGFLQPLGDEAGDPVSDLEEMLGAGYRLDRRYVREMVHILDGRKVFDPKMPAEPEVSSPFSKSAGLTSRLLAHLLSELTPGRQWKAIGADAPSSGAEIHNDKLAAGLIGKLGGHGTERNLNFSEQEVDAWEEPNLSFDNYTRAGGTYFRPVQYGENSVPEAQLRELSLLTGKERERKQRLLIAEMPDAALLPKIREVLQDPFTGPDNIRKLLRIDRMEQLRGSGDASPSRQSVLMSKTATFNMTVPTSPEKVASQSATQQVLANFKKPESGVRDEKSPFAWKAKQYFERHYDPLLLPQTVKEYFEMNPVEPPLEKKGKGKGGGKKKKK